MGSHAGAWEPVKLEVMMNEPKVDSRIEKLNVAKTIKGTATFVFALLLCSLFYYIVFSLLFSEAAERLVEWLSHGDSIDEIRDTYESKGNSIFTRLAFPFLAEGAMFLVFFVFALPVGLILDYYNLDILLEKKVKTATDYRSVNAGIKFLYFFTVGVAILYFGFISFLGWNYADKVVLYSKTSLLYMMLYMAIALIIYFIPSQIAEGRKHRDINFIFLTNLLLGVTVIGWFIALAWAFSPIRQNTDEEEVLMNKPIAPFSFSSVNFMLLSKRNIIVSSLISLVVISIAVTIVSHSEFYNKIMIKHYIASEDYASALPYISYLEKNTKYSCDYAELGINVAYMGGLSYEANNIANSTKCDSAFINYVKGAHELEMGNTVSALYFFKKSSHIYPEAYEELKSAMKEQAIQAASNFIMPDSIFDAIPLAKALRNGKKLITASRMVGKISTNRQIRLIEKPKSDSRKKINDYKKCVREGKESCDSIIF